MRRASLLICLLVFGCDDAATGSSDPRCALGACRECADDTECAPGEICLDRLCTELQRDCGVDRMPTATGCEPVPGFCERNGDCPSGELCDRDTRRCAAPERRRCVDVDDCFADELCVEGVCVTEVPDAGPDAAPPEADAASPEPDAGPDASPPEADAALDAASPDPDAAADAASPESDVGLDAAAPEPDAAVDAAALAPDVAAPEPDQGPPPPEPDAAPDMSVTAPDVTPPEPDQGPPPPEPDQGPPPPGPDLGAPDPDLGPPDAGVDLDAAALEDIGPEDIGPPEPDMNPPERDAFVPPPTPPRGVYEYERLPIGGLDEAWRAAFHPGGGWYVVAENRDIVHVIDWATGESDRFDLTPRRGGLYWNDVEFAPGGEFALLTGRLIDDGEITGVVYRLDADDLDLYRVEAVELPDEAVTGVAWPWEGGLPVLLTQRDLRPGGYVATLRELDPEAGELTEFIAARNSGAGCDDLAFANNEFGDPGILVVCGTNGADVLYYTWVADFPEWRVDPGNNNLGNTSSVAAHPEGDYALIVGWSGRRVFRFQAGLLNDSADAPNFRFQGIYRVAFQRLGQRALVVGRAGVNPIRGTVIEYRHDEYRCPGDFDCELTDVSIPGFDEAPFNADRNTRLNDAAFHPFCDGGVVVGGYTNFQGSAGLVVRFDIVNGADPCE